MKDTGTGNMQVSCFWICVNQGKKCLGSMIAVYSFIAVTGTTNTPSGL